MTLAPATELGLLIVALYCYDCLVLLYYNEGIVERAGTQFRILPGSPRAQLSGRLLRLLNPFAPHRASFRAAWHARDAVDLAGPAEALHQRAQTVAGALAKLAIPVWAIWLVFLMGIPASLLWGTTPVFLWCVGSGYMAILVAIAIAWSQRTTLGLSKSKLGWLTFESLACPPCAANLLRKLSLAVPQGDLANLAHALLPASERDSFFEHIAHCLNDEHGDDSGTAVAERRDRYLAQLRRHIRATETP